MIDWEEIGYWVFWGMCIFLGSVLVGVVGGLLIIVLKGLFNA